MAFRSDAQRRAMFANMNKFSTGSYPADSVLSSEPDYVYDGKINNQFSEESDIAETKEILQEAIDDRKGKKGLDPEKTKKLEKILARLKAESSKSNVGVSLDSYAHDSDFSKGRSPNMGELVYVQGDPSVGIFGYEGRVVEVNKNSAVIQSDMAGDSVREELGFEEFEDQESLTARKEAQEKMHKSWREEEGLNVKEADEVSLEDLEAAAELHDRLKKIYKEL